MDRFDLNPGGDLMAREATFTQRYENRPDAPEFLRVLRDTAFESSDDKLALALGHPTDEVERWIGGTLSIAGDALIKARGLAMERGVQFNWR
jgi:hypothetical protein